MKQRFRHERFIHSPTCDNGQVTSQAPPKDIAVHSSRLDGIDQERGEAERTVRVAVVEPCRTIDESGPLIPPLEQTHCEPSVRNARRNGAPIERHAQTPLWPWLAAGWSEGFRESRIADLHDSLAPGIRKAAVWHRAPKVTAGPERRSSLEQRSPPDPNRGVPRHAPLEPVMHLTRWYPVTFQSLAALHVAYGHSDLLFVGSTMPPFLISKWTERVVVTEIIDIPGISTICASSRVHNRL